MAKIKVELNASHGCDCMGYCYGSDDTIEIEVNEQESEALQKLNSKDISCEVVVEAIENGVTVLQSLHEKLEEKFYYMVEEYWLYEADNECLYECLADHIEQDISAGLYIPTDSDEGDSFDCHCFGCDENEDYDLDDEPEYDLDAYFDWVKEHDHEFAAERVGLDLDACRDDEVNYTINLDK